MREPSAATVTDETPPPPTRMTKWRDRWVRTEYVRVDSLLANPLNWRLHPRLQQDTLMEAINEIGFLDGVEINEITGNMLDGHLRAQLADIDGETVIRADIYNLDPEEEAKYLVTKDPISAMAVADQSKLAMALAQIAGAGPAIQALVADLVNSGGIDDDGLETGPDDKEETEDETAVAGKGELLEKLKGVTIGEPTHQVASGDLWRLGPHVLIVVSVFDGWRSYVPLLTDDNTLLLPYPGPFTPLTDKASEKRLVLVQPDTYLAGWLLDRWAEVHGEASIQQVT